MLAANSPVRGAARTYRLGVVVAAFGLLLTAGVLAAAMAMVSVQPAPAHVVQIVGLRLAIPAANVSAIVLLTLATLGIAVVLASARGVVTALRAQHRFLRVLPVTGDLASHERVMVVADDRPHAFCAGLLRPRVYITTGALEELSSAELDVVLAHEQVHRMRRDPLRIVTGRILGESLFFLPVLRRLTVHYCMLAELAADEHAVATNGGNSSALASAMLAFEGSRIAPERVDRLVGGHTFDWRVPVAVALTSALGVAGLALLVWQLARHAVLQTTLGLPLLSAQPCIVVLALVPLLSGAVGIWTTSRF
jgi:Zn-dependent protease with chaperone function